MKARVIKQCGGRATLALVLAIGLTVQARAQAPELIFHNGKILTVDSNFSTAQAVAIIGDRIFAVGANEEVWAPQERVDRPTALRMLTSWAADYVLKGDKIGTIEKGKYADLVVLDKDYMTIPEDGIVKIAPQVTVFDGKIIYVHKDFSAEYNLKPEGAVISSYDDMVKSRQPRANVGGTGG